MIKIDKLTKEFPKVKALDEFSLEVEKGEIYGLIGPNGAGKTTCLTILATLMEPCSGYAEVDGLDISKNILETRRKIGYMPDFFGAYKNITFFEYLDFFAGCYGLSYDTRMKQIDKVTELVGLQDKINEQVDNLSRGMKQRLCLAKTLLHDPKVLLLDEPASGLDPYARIEIRNILRSVAAEGTTVMISSHILSDLENLCSNIAVIRKGKLIKHGKLNEILDSIKPGRVLNIEIEGAGNGHVAKLEAMKLVNNVEEINNTIKVHIDEEYVEEFDVSQQTISEDILKLLIDDKISIVSFAFDKGRLEDAYIQIAGADIVPD